MEPTKILEGVIVAQKIFEVGEKILSEVMVSQFQLQLRLSRQDTALALSIKRRHSLSLKRALADVTSISMRMCRKQAILLKAGFAAMLFMK